MPTFAHPAPRFLLAPLALAAMLALAGCGSSAHLTDLWRDPGYSGPPARNLLVISMAKTPMRRRMWEDTFAAELRKHGAAATPSYAIFPESVPDTEVVQQAVRDKGFDAVIVTHSLGTERVERFVQPTVSTVPVSRINPWGYYHTYYERVYEPGYTETDQVARFQTDLWVSDGEGGRLVWTGESESVNPGSVTDLTRELSDKIVPAIAKAGLL